MAKASRLLLESNLLSTFQHVFESVSNGTVIQIFNFSFKFELHFMVFFGY